jgi:hypothetical protein
MKKVLLFLSFALVIFGVLVVGTHRAYALECGVLPQSICDQAVTASANSTNPLGGLRPIIDWIANILVALFGMMAVLVIIVSGVQISASAGNENAVKTAKENIFKVITGVVLLISFRAILYLIQGLFDKVNTTNIFTTSGELAKSGIPQLFTNAIALASFAGGVVSLIFIVVGGIRYTTSGGNSNALTGAKKTIIYAIAGLVISISAYGILVFITQQLQK